jgi:hypothetical protein
VVEASTLFKMIMEARNEETNVVPDTATGKAISTYQQS